MHFKNFLVWNRVRVWRRGRHTPTKNHQQNPPIPGTAFSPSCKSSIYDVGKRPLNIFFSLWNFLLIFDTGKTGLLLHTNMKRQTDPYDTFTTWPWRSKQKHKTKNIIHIETNCPIFRFENKPSWGAKRKSSLQIRIWKCDNKINGLLLWYRRLGGIIYQWASSRLFISGVVNR